MIRLTPMTAAEFDRYLEGAVPSYAEAHIKAGDCEADEALALAKADYDSLLPRGLATPGHHLFTIRAEASNDAIGILWFEAREKRGRKSAYIFDFEIDAAWRGKGYGAATLRALDDLAVSMGIGRLSLNVMGWNDGARTLYEKMGFRVAGIGMTKVL